MPIMSSSDSSEGMSSGQMCEHIWYRKKTLQTVPGHSYSSPKKEFLIYWEALQFKSLISFL